jgi:spermidine synthase
VEIVEDLVTWMRDGTIPHGQTMLADARANPVVADVTTVLGEARDASYDLILLDVDNGPNFLVHESNRRVYQRPFLEQAQRILRPGGAILVWSMDRSEELEDTLRLVFGDAEARRHDVRLQDRDEHYWLHVARAR